MWPARVVMNVRTPQERRDARARPAADGEPRQHADDTALRWAVDSDVRCNPVDSIGSSTESRVSHSEPRLLLGFQGTKTARREGKSSPFSDAGCCTSRQNSGARRGSDARRDGADSRLKGTRSATRSVAAPRRPPRSAAATTSAARRFRGYRHERHAARQGASCSTTMIAPAQAAAPNSPAPTSSPNA